MLEINKQEALEFVIGKMKEDATFKGVEVNDIETLAKKVMDADFAYMESANVEEGGVYDEDDAFDFIMEKLGKGLDDENKALVSLITDGYFEYFDVYLEENDLIDWE